MSSFDHPPRSPDASSDASLSPESKTKLKRHILTDMTRIIGRYEPLYLTKIEAASSTGLPLSERCARFQSWLKALSEKRSSLDATINQITLAHDVTQFASLYQAFCDLTLDKPLSREIRKQYEDAPLRPDEFLIDRGDIPLWDELPSEKEIKTTFNFDWIWKDEYREGRKLKDPGDVNFITKETLKDRKGFDPTDQDLSKVKYAENDPVKRAEFLHNVDIENLPETLPPAKIFEIGEIIQQKKKEAEARGETHENSLSTQELLEAFDEANVRPATLKELLAYSKKYWKPKEDLNHPLTDEEKTQRANAPNIYGLGSVFSDSRYRRRVVPYLDWYEGRRGMPPINFDSSWDNSDRFLVFRKES